jgi:outer membrane protein assembly factor BamB
MSPLRRAATALAVLTAACLPWQSTRAADWPQWRGPNRDGKSAETGLLKSWPEGGPPRVWMYTAGGNGYGQPTIVGGKLYVLGVRDDRDALIALDAATGDELWVAPLSSLYRNDWGNGPRGTPTVDGAFVYGMTGDGTLACVRAANGEVVWSKTMQDLGGQIPAWGYSESPFVYKDLVLCTPGGGKGSIAAFNKATGELAWQSQDMTSDAHYASIVAMPHDGHEDGVQLLPDQLVGFELATGKLLWSEPWPKPVAAIPTPVVNDNLAYATSGYGVGCMLVAVGEDHAIERKYDNKVMKNKTGGVVLVGDHIYGHSEGVGWVCQDLASGEQSWRERGALGMGSIAYADGLLYCLGEDDGEMVLIEASPEGWNEHGRFKLEPQSTIRSDRGKIWTHPVISGGMLYLRDQDHVYCYDIRDRGLASVQR